MSSRSSPAPDEQFCPTCGARIKTRAELCPECGVRNDGRTVGVSTEMRCCEACGEQIYRETERCPDCGVRQHPTSGSRRLELPTAVLWLFAVSFVLGGIDMLTDPGRTLRASILGGLLLGLGLVLLPPVREAFDRSYPLTTVGTIKSVDSQPVNTSRANCTVCDDTVGHGVRREYGEEFILFGVTLSTSTNGENVYCERCASADGPTASTVTRPDHTGSGPTGASEGSEIDDIDGSDDDGTRSTEDSAE